ncbi:glycosyltransferase [Rheinheimera sp.]|uniref:glycosyltransferase n=1 Tax=Rheinheimera sp. TaxID=1869214 RepID=UPI0027B9039A|nr:glycosyltransferase [Rheinheimera sp.]
MKKARLLIFSSLFPSSARPNAGLFVRERTFRLAKLYDLTVISPVPWFPGQSLIRLFKPDYRPMPALMETQQGISVYYPRFFSIPGFGRNNDAASMARAAGALIKKLHQKTPFALIDSHFTYPDGLAASGIAKELAIPCTVTLRGTEVPHATLPGRREQLLQTWQQASAMICVSDSLKQHAVRLGADAAKFTVVGNGIDTEKFSVIDKTEARQQLGLPLDAKVLITVGGLVKRKGFHHVINCLPDLIQQGLDVHYLVVGGANAEGNYEPELRSLTAQLGLAHRVHFLGALPPAALKQPLSAADVFVLASANEGWANVILEAMACALPVVATDVGGNAEVVCQPELGLIVPLDEHKALSTALFNALTTQWQSTVLTDYAKANHWDLRIAQLHFLYQRLGGPAEPDSGAKP